MKPFEYANPTTLKDAVDLLSGDGEETAILAGGTDLLGLMKDELETPSRVVDVKGIAELGGIKHSSNGLLLGATATMEDLAAEDGVARRYRALHDAAVGITSPQIRNRGTIAGDLCQRPRCWFYRLGYGLLGMENGQSLVPGGDNRYHAIFGNDGPAYFVSPSSLGPALVAMGAEIGILGPDGIRNVASGDFFVTPGSEDERENVLQAGELVAEVRVPNVPAANATYEVRQKLQLDFPMAAASVVLDIVDGTVSSARVVLGHVAPTPWRSEPAEQVITGQAVTEETAAAAGDAAAAGATPMSRNGYKVQLTRVAVKRAILAAARGS